MSDRHWSQMMLPRERIAQLENVNRELRNEVVPLREQITTLRAQLEQERARVAQLHQAAYPLYSWCAEHLSYEQFKEAYQYGHALGQILEAEHPAVEAFIKRKQAEAVEAAAKECMPGPCGPPDDPPAGYQEYCEGVASVLDYAQRLLNQADDIEKAGDES